MNLTKNVVANQRLNLVQVTPAPSDAIEPNRMWELFVGKILVGWLECHPMICGMACGWTLCTQDQCAFEVGISVRGYFWQTYRLPNTATTQIPYGHIQEKLLYLAEEGRL